MRVPLQKFCGEADCRCAHRRQPRRGQRDSVPASTTNTSAPGSTVADVDAAVHRGRELAHEREADAGADRFARELVFAAIEELEDPPHLLLRHARTEVAHGDERRCRSICSAAREHDVPCAPRGRLNFSALSTRLMTIWQNESASASTSRAIRGRVAIDVELEAGALESAIATFERALSISSPTEIGLSSSVVWPRVSRDKAQHVADQAREPFAFVEDEVVVAPLLRFVRPALAQHFAVHTNRRERRFQLMADRRDEVLLLAIELDLARAEPIQGDETAAQHDRRE